MSLLHLSSTMLMSNRINNPSTIDAQALSAQLVSLMGQCLFQKQNNLDASTASNHQPKKRKNRRRVSYVRLDWKQYAWMFRNDPSFIHDLRMYRSSFNKLCGMIEKDLLVDKTMGALRGGAISPEICLFMTIRKLSGTLSSDIYSQCGMSKGAYHICLRKTLYAILACDPLGLHFPQSDDECRAHARGFQQITGSAIKNCVSVVDGIHIPIRSPPERIGNNRAYFSGHDKSVGLNVQAACDHMCRFTAVSIEAPGSMNDRLAIKKSFMYPLFNNLKSPFVVIGDAAYEPTETVVPVYYGLYRNIALYDNFNFYASIGRIRIEMAFGYWKNKFGIFQKPLACTPANIKLYILAAVRLHNYCINERLERNGWIPEKLKKKLPDAAINADQFDPIPPEDEPDLYKFFGHSNIREEMAAEVALMGLTRPPKRNNNNQ